MVSALTCWSAEVPGIYSGGIYKLTAQCSGRALTVEGGGTASGVNIHQWSDSGSSSQLWKLEHVSDGYYKLTAQCSGKLLDVSGGSLLDGGNVQQWADANNNNQRWKIVDCGGGWFNLIAKVSGKCLDVAGAATGDGINIQQMADNGSTGQRWKLLLVSATGLSAEVVSPGLYRLTAKHSGKALDVAGGSLADGALVQQWTDNGSDAQRWNIERDTSPSFRIVSQRSGRRLEISNASQADGAGAQQWSAQNADNQRWLMTHTGSDWFTIAAKHSGKNLDVSGNSSADGAKVHQWTSTSGDNQKWRLTPCYNITLNASTAPIVVAVGDIVRVTAPASGTVTAYEACGAATTPPFSTTQGLPFTLPTTGPGFFRYVLRDSAGAEVADLEATVVRINLSTLSVADQYGYTRQLVAKVEPAGAPVTFASSNLSRLSVGIATVNGTNATLQIKSITDGDAAILGCIKGPSGLAIIGRTTVRGFSLETNAQKYILITEIFPDETAKAEGKLSLKPHISGLSMKMTTFVSGVTFEDSTTTKHFTTNDFTLGSDGSTYLYYLLQSLTGHAKLCHTITAYQNGFQVSRGW